MKKKKNELQNSIELNRLDYKKHKFGKASLVVIFLSDIYANHLLIENTDIEQRNLKKVKHLNKGKKSAEKVSFLIQ